MIVFFFCANVRIWINLGEKYGTKFGVLLIYYILKNVEIKVDNNILWNTQNAPDRTIFPGGACDRNPLAQVFISLN